MLKKGRVGGRKIRIKFKCTDDVLRFVSIANECNSDIIVSYGHIDFDGKSTVGMMNIPVNKILNVQINSINPDEEEKFYKTIKEYRV